MKLNEIRHDESMEVRQFSQVQPTLAGILLPTSNGCMPTFKSKVLV